LEGPVARLIPILIFLVTLLVFALAITTASPPRPRGTYRPRTKWRDPFAGPDAASSPGTVHIVPRAQLAGLRDAYSSAPLDPEQPLVRCGDCQAFYHAVSAQALTGENAGRCVVCGGRDLGPVRIAAD